MKRSLSLPAAGIGALVLGLASFGAGFAVRALDGDGERSNTSPGPTSNNAIAPGRTGFPGQVPATGDIAANQALGRNGAVEKAGYGTNDLSFQPSCQADLPAAVGVSGVDLARANFAFRPLGDSFAPVSFSVRAEADCGSDGDSAAPGSLMVDSSWRHKDTGIQVTITQAASKGDVANVIRQNQASFTSAGYAFQLYANVYYYAGAKDSVVPPSSSSREPSTSSFAPGGPDPRAEAVILAAIKDLAPDLGDQCFAREVSGDWSDLAKFGLGDPRPAFPGGYELRNITLIYMNPASQDCGSAAALSSDRGLQFSADWYHPKEGGNISIYAGGMGIIEKGQPAGFGQISDNMANWQARNINFSIYGNNKSGGIGVDRIRKIARALDPSFSEACFLTETIFKSGDLPKYSLNSPKIPDGYKARQERGVIFSVADGCEMPEGYVRGALSFYGEYADGDNNVLNISLDRSAYGKVDPGMGYIAESNIFWANDAGVMFSVSGYSQDGGSGPTLDTLKSVAKSLDPTVDFSKLQDANGGGGIKPMPAVAPDGASRSSAPPSR